MSFSSLLEKMMNGEVLGPQEKQEMILEARRLEEVASLVTSITVPGTKNLTIDGLVANNIEANYAVIRDATIESATAGGGDVIIDSAGIAVKNNIEAIFSFMDTDGSRGSMFMQSTDINGFEMGNIRPGGPSENDGVTLYILDSLGYFPYMQIMEDPSQPGHVLLKVIDGAGGVRLQLGEDSDIDLRSAGDDASASTFVRARLSPNTPPAPASNDAYHMYLKGDKLIIQYDDGVALRYKYLPLSGTGVTWVHTTTAP